MLRIGFATEFYTLWDISKEIMYSTNARGEHFPSYEKVSYYYMQNLSKDEFKAKEKAKNMGAIDLDVDEELFGRNNSFSKQVKLNSELPRNINPFFTFGKYQEAPILECVDISYLEWYFKETNNRYAKQVLLANGYVEFDNNVYNQEEYAKILENLEKAKIRDHFVKSLESGEQIELTFTILSNANSYGIVRTTLPLDLIFTETKAMYYKGIEYYLPIIDTKAKKLKNKEITAIVELTKAEYENYNFLKLIKIK